MNCLRFFGKGTPCGKALLLINGIKSKSLMEIVAVIMVAVFMTVVVVKIGEKEYREGYQDCVNHFKTNKNLIPFEHSRDSYEKGWNKACEDLRGI